MKTADPQKLGLDPARLARIGDWMQRYVDEQKYPGSTVLIARGGHEVYFNAAGRRNIDADLPFQRDTVARIYSMTKPVTTVALMMLAERGLFHLEAPVSEFIPSFSDCHALIPAASSVDQTEPCATPTLHQLLTHTSGLSYHFNPGLLPRAMDAEGLRFDPGNGPLGDMVDRLAALPLAFQPGTRWEYSTGIDVIGRVIEVVSGQSLQAFVKEHVLDPLGMNETGFSVPAGTGDQFAALYTSLEGDPTALNAVGKGDPVLRYTGDGPGSSDFETTSLASGGGGLVGTIDDYMGFVEMLRRGGTAPDGARLLGPRTLAFMMRNHLPGEIASMGPQSFAEQPMEGMGFGLGGAVVLNPARARSPGSIGDFSWGGLASTFFWLDRELDLSVVFFTQLQPSSAYPARSQLKALVHAAMMS